MSRMKFETNCMLRPVIQQIEDDAKINIDNATTMSMQELKRLRILLCWAYRQQTGHINVAPQHYTPMQATAWVKGWDSAFSEFWSMFDDMEKLTNSVPEEDLNFRS